MRRNTQPPLPEAAAGSFDVSEILTGALSNMPGMLSGAFAAAPLPFIIAAALMLLVVLSKVAAAVRPAGPKDPSRLFSANQRKEGFDRAGGRCELEGRFFSRCRRPAHHGDHWFPWSRGGSTSMANFVAACVKCNLAKGAKVPGAWQTMRLESRRRKYFAQGLNAKAGEHFKHR